jgi:thiol-disulfide isomerase/thioredoxin
MKLKKILSSNFSFIVALIAMLLLAFNPEAKALVITGLMKIGLFQPDIKDTTEAKNGNYLPRSIAFADKDGKLISLSDQKGKVLFINFWATWCPPCIAEMPSINKLYNKFKDNKNIVFLMVDVDGNSKKSTRFMERKNYSLPVYTPASAIPSSILDGSIPTTLIVDKKGKIVFKHTGGADYGNEKLLKFLDDLTKI